MTEIVRQVAGQPSSGSNPKPRVLFIGRTTVDAVYWLDRLPEEDSKVFARAFRAAPGGPACNAAIAHALMGGQATLMSAVGGGPWAAVVREELERRNVALIDLAGGTDYQTPLTTVMVSGAEAKRTIVNPPLQDVQMKRLQPDLILPLNQPPPIAMSDGFHLADGLPLLAACRKKGSELCLDGGSWKPGTDELAPLLTYAIASERFALPGKPADPEATLAWFAELGVPYAAVTRGPRPILAMDRGRRFEIEIPRTPVVDTLGAGDVLHGAFCFYAAQRWGFERALRQAAAIATQSCLGDGIESALRGEGWGERPAAD